MGLLILYFQSSSWRREARTGEGHAAKCYSLCTCSARSTRWAQTTYSMMQMYLKKGNIIPCRQILLSKVFSSSAGSPYISKLKVSVLDYTTKGKKECFSVIWVTWSFFIHQPNCPKWTKSTSYFHLFISQADQQEALHLWLMVCVYFQPWV